LNGQKNQIQHANPYPGKPRSLKLQLVVGIYKIE